MRKDGRKTEKEAKSFALPTWAPVLLLTRDDTAVSGERIWIDRLVHRISTAALELWIWREEESAGTSGYSTAGKRALERLADVRARQAAAHPVRSACACPRPARIDIYRHACVSSSRKISPFPR